MHSDHQLGQYIPLHYHYQMLLDEARMRGFGQAIEYAVQADAKVLELGGGTGVLSCFAARQKAKVWCVERQPDLADTARRMLADNGVADRVEVVTGDASDFLPPEPVDFVICEMLHSALLREKQIEIIADFQRRYLEKFERLPRFIPEATILAVEPVRQNYDFYGYHASIPLFEDPANPFPGTESLGDPVHYAIIDYAGPLPAELKIEGQIGVGQGGTVNALRFITGNILAVQLETGDTIQWKNQNLILPLAREIVASPGELLDVSFAYKPGDPIQTLMDNLRVNGRGAGANTIADAGATAGTNVSVDSSNVPV